MSDGLSDFADLLVDKILLSIAEREITDTYLSFQQSPGILKFVLENIDNNDAFNSQNIPLSSNINSEDMQYRIPTTSEFMINLLPEKLAKQDAKESKSDPSSETFTRETSLDMILSQSNTPNIQTSKLSSTNNGKNPMGNALNGNEPIYVKCDICSREIVANRFAQHLERCLNGKAR